MGAEPAPHVDLLSGAFYAQARPTYAWMRAHEPVFHDEANGLWAFATHELVQAAGRDPATFSNAGGSRPDTGPLPWMIDLDGPAHRTRRRLVSGAFTPARVRGRRPAVEEICDELIDAVCEAGACDVVARPRGTAADDRHRRHARGRAGGPRHAPRGGPTTCSPR